jgi:localization factor PodJL
MRYDVHQNVAGIPADARKMVNMAARRTGLSVGEWLNSVILDAAAEEGVRPVQRVFKERGETPNPTKGEIASIYSRLDDIAKKIERLEQGDINMAALQEPAASEVPTHMHQLISTLERLTDYIQKMRTEQLQVKSRLHEVGQVKAGAPIHKVYPGSRPATISPKSTPSWS